MQQIFVLGASSVYGVGAERAGWGDLVKSYVNGLQFAPDGPGECCEVFNFAKAGSTIEFISGTLPWLCKQYKRPNTDLLVLISVGGNDARAKDTPDGFVCTTDEFRAKVQNLVALLQQHAQQIIFVSNGFIDDAKLSPKVSPLDGSASYFSDARRAEFNDITQAVCQAANLSFVTAATDKTTWLRECLYRDGLHPNQTGYQQIFEAIQPVLNANLLITKLKGGPVGPPSFHPRRN